MSNTEIRVAIPGTASFATAGGAARRAVVDALFEYFNQHFELYGRRLVPVFVGSGASNATNSRALGAETVAGGVFGALTGYQEAVSSPQVGLAQELARGKVVTITRNQATWWTDAGLYDVFHPYLWSLHPSSEQIQRQLGAVACALAGGTARHALDPNLRSQTRKFGIVAMGNQVAPSASVVSGVLEACTGQRPERVDLNAERDSAVLRTAPMRLKDAGVTTVICICEGDISYSAINGSHTGGYDPEWIKPPSMHSSGDEYVVQYAALRAGMPTPIQVQPGSPLLPMQGRLWFRAVLSVNPSIVETTAATRDAWGIAEYLYDQLVVLAAGVQGAGPTLTPDTFARALMTTSFPNPGAGKAPFWQPSVGFGPGDHAFYDDHAIGWFSKSAPAVDPTSISPTGSWCYVGAGARYRPDTLPANLDQLLYDDNLPCR